MDAADISRLSPSDNGNNDPMAAIDSRIDDLYKGQLGGFVAARTALAKTMQGADAAAIKRLQKPTVVPWAVNQVYWRARPVFERLVSSGDKVRSAQIAALKGRAADVRRATDAHRKAVADAVAEAIRLASAAGAHPGADELTRMLEAVSLARELPEPPGRFTKVLQPAGFEALAGVPVRAVRRAVSSAAESPQPSTTSARKETSKPDKFEERRRAAEDRRKKKAIERAQASVARAKAAEARARTVWERARQEVAAAELAAAALQRST
jgi:hypothetical protein